MVIEGWPPVVLEVEAILRGLRSGNKIIAGALFVVWRCLALPGGVPIEINLSRVKAGNEMHGLFRFSLLHFEIVAVHV